MYPGNQTEFKTKNDVFIQTRLSQMISKTCKYVLVLPHHQEEQISYGIKVITLKAPTPQNGQTYSTNSSQSANEMF